MDNWRLTVIIEQDEDGAFVARCQELPGCWSCGDTEAETMENIREAIVGCLRVRLKWAIDDLLKQAPSLPTDKPIPLAVSYA